MPEAAPISSDAPAGPRPWWGLGDAAVGWLIALAGGAIASTIVLSANGLEPDQQEELSLGWVAVAQVGLWVGFLGVPWFAARVKGRGLVQDFGLRCTPSDVGIGAAWGTVTQLVLISLLYAPIFWLTDIGAEEMSAPARDLTDRASDPFGVVMLVLIVGIGAPVFEEIFYRGLLLRSLERRFGQQWAVVGSGVVFGLAHFQPLQAPALIMFGVVVGSLTVRYGRLGPAIAAHVVFNMVTVVSLLLSL
jgi:membrane protease YdiL (CAAX protease family)